MILIRNYIESNIATALAAVSTDRADNFVSTEPPKSYFIYPSALGLRAPAIFVIGESIDFRKPQGANIIDALNKINVSALIEERDANRLTYKAWRYLSALQQVLDLAVLTSTDGKLKLVIKVMRAEFSDIYTKTGDKNAPNAVFRKEVYLTLECEHYENY